MQSLKGRLCSLVQSKSIGSRGAVLPFPNRKRYTESFRTRFQDFRQDLKISDKISGFQSRISRLQRDFKISKHISGFTPDFKISAQIYGFHSDLRGISEKVYEISRSGGPLGTIINPRRACAARVTVLVLSFCPSVCPVPLILPLRATRRPKSDTNGFSTTLS